MTKHQAMRNKLEELINANERPKGLEGIFSHDYILGREYTLKYQNIAIRDILDAEGAEQ